MLALLFVHQDVLDKGDGHTTWLLTCLQDPFHEARLAGEAEDLAVVSGAHLKWREKVSCDDDRLATVPEKHGQTRASRRRDVRGRAVRHTPFSLPHAFSLCKFSGTAQQRRLC